MEIHLQQSLCFDYNSRALLILLTTNMPEESYFNTLKNMNYADGVWDSSRNLDMKEKHSTNVYNCIKTMNILY